MTSYTPAKAIPYPDPGDLVTSGDDAMKALAERVETLLQALDGPPVQPMMRRAIPAGSLPTFPNGSLSTVSWPTLVDSNAGLTYVTNGIQVDVAGRYDIVCSLRWSASATGRRAISLLKGATPLADVEVGATASGIVTTQATVLGVDLAAGDLLTVQGFQDSGAVRTLAGDASSNYFHVVRRSNAS